MYIPYWMEHKTTDERKWNNENNLKLSLLIWEARIMHNDVSSNSNNEVLICILSCFDNVDGASLGWRTLITIRIPVY